MESNKLILLFITMTLSLCINSKIELKELIIRQTPGQTLYTSQDGKISFYQKRNGHLAFLKNFKISEILKGVPQTKYLVISGSDKKTFLLAQNETFLSSNSIRTPWEIFHFNTKNLSTQPLGKGLNPKIDFLNTWAIYYNPDLKTIHFKSLVNSLLNFNLQINAAHNPFFTPEYLMLDNNQVLFSDENKSGNISLFLFTRNTKKTHLIYQPSSPGQKIELCKMNEQLYMGKFSLNGIDLGSQIIELNLKNKLNYSKGRIIYESSHNDYGNLICSSKKQKIYFIKSIPVGKSHYEYTSDVVKLDPKKKDITHLTKQQNITQIIEMDNRILIPYNGKFLIAEGEHTQDDSLN